MEQCETNHNRLVFFTIRYYIDTNTPNGMKKQTLGQFKERFISYYGNDYNLDDTIYVDSNTKLGVICNKHGIVNIIPYDLFKSKLSPCKHCRKENTIRVKDTKTFIQKSIQIHGDIFDYSLSEYKSNSQEIDIICKEHGKFSLIADNHLSKNRGCPSCKSRHSLNQEDILIRFNKIHNNKYKYPNFKYNTVYDYMDVECLVHGNFQQKISIHLNGHGCPKCGLDSIRNTQYDFETKSNIIHKNKYNYNITSYKHSQEKVSIICPKHGIFSQIARDHLHGNGCGDCANEIREYSSSYEKEIYNFIKSKKSELELIQNYRIKKEIDVYIPDFNLGIEFNGTYWHSHLHKNKNYHKEKSDYFKSKGINIFHVWEYQWNNPIKRKIIESMISNKLRLNLDKIYARKCIIKEIKSKEYREFCNNTIFRVIHLQPLN